LGISLLLVFRINDKAIPPKKKEADKIITANKNFRVIRKSMYKTEKSKLILKIITGPNKMKNPEHISDIIKNLSLFKLLNNLNAKPPRPNPKIDTDKIKKANV